MAFNLEDATLAKREVRQALAYATEPRRNYPISFCAARRVSPTVRCPQTAGPMSPAFDRYEYDPQQAERLLDAAGFPRDPELVGCA